MTRWGASGRPRSGTGLLLVLSLAACGDSGTSAGSVTSTSGPSASTSSSVRSSSTLPASTTTSTETGPAEPVLAEPADEVVVDCDGETARLSTDTVTAQPDGIHVTVRNTTDEEVVLNFVGQGDVVPPGVTETVQVMAPRSLVISCGYDANREIVVAGTVEVVDPGGVWRRTDIDCSRLPLTRWEEPMGRGSSPEEAVRWWLVERPEALVQPVPPDSEIVPVGYPAAASPVYVTRVDGRDADIFQLAQSDGVWTATPHEGCPRLQP